MLISVLHFSSDCGARYWPASSRALVGSQPQWTVTCRVLLTRQHRGLSLAVSPGDLRVASSQAVSAEQLMLW